HRNTLKALAELLEAAGLPHPHQLRPHHIAQRLANGEIRVLSALFPHLEKGALLARRFRQAIVRTSWPIAQAHTFTPTYSLSAALSGDTRTQVPGQQASAQPGSRPDCALP